MIRTTYKKQGDGIRSYDYYTKAGTARGIDLHGWGQYGSSSVLAGQSMKSYLDTFDTEEELDAALIDAGINPEDVQWSSKWIEPQNTFDHLPDGSDW